MNVLVTGGAGFIGSHVVRALLAYGAQVAVFDSFVTGLRENVPEGVEVIEADIRDIEALMRAMEGRTHVVHLAALVSVPESIKRPEETRAINVEGTENVFSAAAKKGVARLVYASSAAVYGDEPSIPKTEQSELHSQSPYAASKIANEETAARYVAEGKLSAMGLRFFNVYGPGQSGSHPYASVIPRWVEAICSGQTVTIFGDGSQTRDFVHVRDVAEAVIKALSVSETGICNIASGTELSLQSLLERIEKISDKPVIHECVSVRPGDIQRSVASIDRAKAVLTFAPSVSFEEGLRELVGLQSL